MHFNWTVTGDGLATLVAGIIAFCAVWWQVRSSTSNLQNQLGAEKAAREQERDLRSRAVATAILFEIDTVCRLISEQANADFYRARNLPSLDRFVVYEANADALGGLEHELARAIVRFYGAAARHYLASCQCLERIAGEQGRAANRAADGWSMLTGTFTAGGEYLAVLEASWSEVRGAATEACERLLSFTGTDRSAIYTLSHQTDAEAKTNAQTN